jgi:hypothetical protein
MPFDVTLSPSMIPSSWGTGTACATATRASNVVIWGKYMVGWRIYGGSGKWGDSDTLHRAYVPALIRCVCSPAISVSRPAAEHAQCMGMPLEYIYAALRERKRANLKHIAKVSVPVCPADFAFRLSKSSVFSRHLFGSHFRGCSTT